MQQSTTNETVRSPWLDTNGAANYLGNSPKSLAVWRCKGQGPRYHTLNKRLVRYHINDLDAFVRGEDGR